MSHDTIELGRAATHSRKPGTRTVFTSTLLVIATWGLLAAWCSASAQADVGSLWVGSGAASLTSTTPPDTANACGSLQCATLPVTLPEYDGSGKVVNSLQASSFNVGPGTGMAVSFLGSNSGSVITGDGDPFVALNAGGTWAYAPTGVGDALGNVLVVNCDTIDPGCLLGIWKPDGTPSLMSDGGLGNYVRAEQINPAAITWLSYGSPATRITVDAGSMSLDHTGRYLIVRGDDPSELLVWDLDSGGIADLGGLVVPDQGTPSELSVAIDGVASPAGHLYAAAGQFWNQADGVDIWDLSGCSFKDPAQVALGGSGEGCPMTTWSQLLPGTPVPYDVFGLHFTDPSAGRLWLATSAGSGPESGYYLTSSGYTPPAPLTFTIMGDSFMSGEGAGDYADNTNPCHNSLESMGQQIAAKLGTPPSAIDISCSGASTSDVVSKQFPRYPGLGVTLLGAAGDDDHFFSGLIFHCFAVNAENELEGSDLPCLPAQTVASYGYYMQHKLLPALESTYEGARGKAHSVGGEVWAADYPLMVDTNSSSCGANVNIVMPMQSDRVAVDRLETYLNTIIQYAATVAGVNFLDRANSLDGFKLCDKAPAVNGVTEGAGVGPHTHVGDTLIGIPLSIGSFHPNLAGQTLMARYVEAQYGASFGHTGNPDPVASPPALQAYQTALGVPTATYTAGLPPVLSVDPGNPLLLDVLLSGLRPLSIVTAFLHSTPTNLGTFQVDASGDATVPLPTSIPQGVHELQISGTADDGTPVQSAVAFTAGTSDDTDGDGIPNSSDTCPDVPTTLADNALTTTDGLGVDCENPPPPPPPSVSCGQADGTWHAANVEVNCQATDNSGTGLQDPSQAATTLRTSVAAGSADANAATNSVSVCDNLGDCATAGPIAGNMVDLVAPTVTCDATPTYAYGSAGGTVAATVTDAASGPVSATVSAPAVVSMVGAQGVQLTGADEAGNVTSVTCPYVIAKAPQAIAFKSQPSANPAVGTTYAVATTGGASGNAVALTVDTTSTPGACSLTNASVTFGGPGNCVIDANQAGNSDYLQAPQVQQQITVTPVAGSLCTLALRDIQTSANYLRLPRILQLVVTGVANSACETLKQITPRLAPSQKAALIKSYAGVLSSLVGSGWLTAAQATALETLAGQLA